MPGSHLQDSYRGDEQSFICDPSVITLQYSVEALSKVFFKAFQMQNFLQDLEACE